MSQFVLKINFFEFNINVFQQIFGTAIGTKFAPTYTCIFMDQIEIKFLRTQSHQPMVWFRYIENIVFIWTHGEMGKKKLKSLWQILRPLMPIFNLRMSQLKKVLPF